MIDILTYLLFVSSLAYLVTRSKLTRVFREIISRSTRQARIAGKPGVWPEIERLIHCEYCMGFWLGLANYGLFFRNVDVFSLICYGFVSAIFSLLVINLSTKG